jgi:signal transduction histidine kinase
VRRWDGALLLLAVTALSLAAVSSSEPVTYVAFPALMLVAFRLGPPGAVLGVMIATVVVIGVTAHDVGPFSKQPIDHRTLATQVFVLVMTLTTLFVAAVVCERERAARELADATRREGERAMDERHRIARELHDSVSQSLFSTALETRTAQRALATHDETGVVAGRLAAIDQLTRGAQKEMRAMIFELADDHLDEGFEVALARHVAAVTAAGGPTIEIHVQGGALPAGREAQAQLFAIAREALANVLKHARASVAEIWVSRRPGVVVLEVRDDGAGFDPQAAHPGHYGLESMRGRAASIGGHVSVSSARDGAGTVVRAEVPLDAGGRPDRR